MFDEKGSIMDLYLTSGEHTEHPALLLDESTKNINPNLFSVDMMNEEFGFLLCLVSLVKLEESWMI